ncbi:odorant receptor 22a-like [Drosophila bipectinata]|uniref:odorant receptor 22a-like n=1 Tax=Drosophila bipectinata TaxID=42026 RepID=UPI0038B34060
MLSRLYPLTKEKSLEERVQSRDAYIYLERAMWVFGWTEPNNKRWKLFYKLWMFFTTFVINVLVPLAMVAEYVHSFSSFSVGEFLSSLQICINMFGCSLKCAFINLGYPKFQEAKRVLDKLDESCQRDEEKIGVRRYVAWGNLCFAIYHILFSFSVVVNGAGFMLIGRHAWRMYFPFISPDENFLLTNFFECFLMGSVVGMELCTDVSALIYMLMGRCHITLLRNRLSTLRMDSDKSEKHHDLELTKCIQIHRLILDYFDVLRPVLSRSIFVQFLLIGVVLGLSAINVMFFTTFWTGIGTFSFMLGVSLETFPFCHLCDVIIDDSRKLSDSLFHSNWFTADRRYKTTLVYFLHNLQQPITLTAGGVFPICSKTNLAMVKLAFSVVTVIKQFNFAEMFH